MERRRIVELLEVIRSEHRFGVETIQGLAKKLKTDRRMVRQVLASAIPPERTCSRATSSQIGAAIAKLPITQTVELDAAFDCRWGRS